MPRPKGSDPDVTKLVRESRFVFTGTIEQQGLSSLAFVPASSTTSVVRVERVHHATAALHNQVDQRVRTIRSNALEAVVRGLDDASWRCSRSSG